MEIDVIKAKSKLSDLLKKVEEGEEIIITRRGKPVAVLSQHLSALPDTTDLRASQPLLSSSADLIRKMRDESF